ncbi:hypothetical protein WA026_015706 [Henosepilachna vigintioctopunctata]|uniref:Uncharacterized protein n=1 Tax=Henosepilachna vigintioctopunctata TaxID=420089 RepID=A0AAW1V1S2_9CUCU
MWKRNKNQETIIELMKADQNEETENPKVGKLKSDVAAATSVSGQYDQGCVTEDNEIVETKIRIGEGESKPRSDQKVYNVRRTPRTEKTKLIRGSQEHVSWQSFAGAVKRAHLHVGGVSAGTYAGDRKRSRKILKRKVSE